MSYSQNDEERVILECFGTKSDGHLLEIGAYDGKTFSNSLALIERGWSAVCVEPSPGPLTGLLRLHAQRPNVRIVQAAVIPHGTAGPLVFHDSGGDAISTLAEPHKAKWEASGSKFAPFHIFPISVGQLLGAFGKDFDFLSLDVEGTNWEIFAELPLADMPRLKLICVEHDFRSNEMLELASRHGFQQITVNGENLILGRRS